MRILTLLSTSAALTLAANGVCAQNLVQNGSFEQRTSASVPGVLGNVANLYINPLTAWNFGPAPAPANYFQNLLLTPGYADSLLNAVKGYAIYGPAQGVNNGLTLSQDGGNFVALDGNYAAGTQQPSLTQLIGGLTVGATYQLAFDFASGEGSNVAAGVTTQPTTESLIVSFGSNTVQTETRHTDTRGFTPWAVEQFRFVASATSELLSFMAAGAPQGSPPESLLDGVSLYEVAPPPVVPPVPPVVNPVPEPSTWMLLVGGLGIMGFVRSRRTQSQH